MILSLIFQFTEREKERERQRDSFSNFLRKMENDLEKGHRPGGGGRPRGGSNVGGGSDGRRDLDINSSGDGGGRTAPRTNRRSGGAGGGGGGEGSGGGGGRRERRINREQRWMISLAFHAVYLTFNGLLYMLIQIKYQNVKSSPFDTHVVMISSLVALCVYFYSAALQIILELTNKELDDPRLLNHVLVCSGILLPLSTTLVFLPNMVGWIVVVVIVFATTILLAYDVFCLIFNCISKRNNGNNNNATPTSESMGLEMSTRINHNAATTSEFLEISIENSNQTSRNNNNAVEMRTGNNVTGSKYNRFYSF